MTVFEYFTVLLSFVVSLGVATLLSAVARMLQERRRVVWSWAYALWAATIFNLQVTYWLKSWSYHERFTLSISYAAPPLVLAILAFLACGLATPHVPEEGPIDLRQFHQRQGRKYALMVAIFMAVATVQGFIMAPAAVDNLELPIDATLQIVFALASLAAVIFHRVTWIQLAVPAAFLIGSVNYYATLIGW
jgi:hypothetical protein